MLLLLISDFVHFKEAFVVVACCANLELAFQDVRRGVLFCSLSAQLSMEVLDLILNDLGVAETTLIDDLCSCLLDERVSRVSLFEKSPLDR